MTCEELIALLMDFVGNELVVEERQSVEIHIAGCERCDIIVQSYSHTVRVARVLPKCGSLPATVEARLRAAIEPELKSDKPADQA